MRIVPLNLEKFCIVFEGVPTSIPGDTFLTPPPTIPKQVLA